MSQIDIKNFNDVKLLVKYNHTRAFVFNITLFFMSIIFAYTPSVNLFIASVLILYLQYSVLTNYYCIPRTSPVSTGRFVNQLLKDVDKIIVFSYLLELSERSNYKDYSQDEISIYLNVIDYLKETRNEKELIALSKHNLALTDKLISNTIENRLNEML